MPAKKKTGATKKKKSTKKAPVVIPVDDKLPALANLKNSVLVNTIAFAEPQSLTRLVAHYDYGSSLSSMDVNGSTPVHTSVQKNDLKMTQTLVDYRKINLDAREIHSVGGQAALHYACIARNPRMVDILLKGGANPNIKSDSTVGETPLQVCCKLGEIECGRLLIQAGASPEAKDNFGNNATFWATKYRQEAIIRELNLPPSKSPTADEFLALLVKNNPRFTLPAIKTKAKAKSKDGKKKGKK